MSRLLGMRLASPTLRSRLGRLPGWRTARSLRLETSLVLLLGLLALGACTPAARAGAQAPGAAGQGPLRPVSVADQDFGPRLAQLLLTDQDPGYRNLLAGVVRRQLQRAASRFDAGHAEAGVAALTGALLLMRAGELHPGMLEGGAPALRDGTEEVARTGNEGYALALYSMLGAVLPRGPERADVELHVEALAEWHRASKASGAMQGLGAEQRSAMNRSLFEPTAPALQAAAKATTTWIQRALSSNVTEMPLRTAFEREEALEAYRAIRAGSAELVALYLRHGDAAGAVQALDGADLGRVMPPGLRERLERVTEDDDPVAWRDLFQTFSAAEQNDEAMLSPELARGAAWGAALGFYRSQPENLVAAMGMAQLLVGYGMSEGAPLVLTSALQRQPGAREVSVAMAIVLRAILAEDEASQLAAARRTYQAALPIIALAESKRSVGRVAPSSGRLAFVMGSLETRAGELGRARPLIEKAVGLEPTLEALMLFSLIERQRGDAASALKTAERALALARQAGEAAAEVDALLLKFEIYRDSGNSVAARDTLRAALTRALDAQKAAAANAEQARSERALARVLEQYGDAHAARRATERAYQASRSDLRQLTATLLDASRRALTRSDLTTGRDAVQRAIDANLEAEDLIYLTLWLQLLERKLKVQADGTTEAGYAAVDDAAGWIAKLKAWGRGKLDNDQLLKAARTRVEQTEAKFYAAMATHVIGDDSQALPRLREVASSEAIELVEVSIARDLTATKLQLPLPENLRVP